MLRRTCIAATICLVLIVIGSGYWLSLPPVQAPVASDPEPPKLSLKHAFELAPANLEHELESPDIAVDSLGRIYLVWASREKEAQKTMFLSVSSDDGESFSEPRVVSRTALHETELHAAGESHHEMGMSPRLAADGEKVTAAWIQSVAENSTVCLVSIESTDGGQSFSSPISVNQSLKAHPNFTSLAAHADRQVYCWLDLRDQQRQVFTALAGESTTPAEHPVFKTAPSDRACKCCPTAVAFSPDGQLFVAFREADQILLARSKSRSSGFESVIEVAKVVSPRHNCGHDCPSLAVDAGRIYISWTDASEGVPRVQCASAKLANLAFESEAINPRSGNAESNCKLLIAGGVLHAVWEEASPAEQFITIGGHDHSEKAGHAIKYSTRKVGDRGFSPAVHVDDAKHENQTHPVLASNGKGGIFVAWNQASDQERAVVVKRLPQLPANGPVQ